MRPKSRTNLQNSNSSNNSNNKDNNNNHDELNYILIRSIKINKNINRLINFFSSYMSLGTRKNKHIVVE
jgi:hypothetical protein